MLAGAFYTNLTLDGNMWNLQKAEFMMWSHRKVNDNILRRTFLLLERLLKRGMIFLYFADKRGRSGKIQFTPVKRSGMNGATEVPVFQPKKVEAACMGAS